MNAKRVENDNAQLLQIRELLADFLEPYFFDFFTTDADSICNFVEMHSRDSIYQL